MIKFYETYWPNHLINVNLSELKELVEKLEKIKKNNLDTTVATVLDNTVIKINLKK